MPPRDWKTPMSQNDFMWIGFQDLVNINIVPRCFPSMPLSFPHQIHYLIAFYPQSFIQKFFILYACNWDFKYTLSIIQEKKYLYINPNF